MRGRALALVLVVVSVVIGCLSGSVEDRFNKGQELLFDGRYEDAESHFLTMARVLSREGTANDKIWQAKALFHAGRIEHLYLNQPRRAVARLREALKLDRDAPFAFEAIEEIAFIFYDSLRDYRTAALEFERLVSAFPKKAGIEKYQYRIAQCYFMLREFNQARTEARLLVENFKDSPHMASAMLLVANSFYVEGRYQEAADAHQQFLEIRPDIEIESRSRFELGMCYQELGEHSRAEMSYLAALKRHPRPDLVKAQLESLQKQMRQETGPDQKKSPYSTVPIKGSGALPKKTEVKKSKPKDVDVSEGSKRPPLKEKPVKAKPEAESKPVETNKEEKVVEKKATKKPEPEKTNDKEVIQSPPKKTVNPPKPPENQGS
ncbi:MAG: tetratricopeptide repeat protein [Deltaproteobacteria bacterium]|nr:tetratricopeptide repeat protein [Deltaproteobacteria bacterium]MBW1873652.1 tetratricopeptide repeat protein [Deltaproteobacteria bacterium]